MSTESERLTRAEWERRVALEGCAQWGHEYEHIINLAGDLIRITCYRCGKTWKVEEL